MPEYLFWKQSLADIAAVMGSSAMWLVRLVFFRVKKTRAPTRPLPLHFLVIGSPDIDLYGRHRGARCDVNR